MSSKLSENTCRIWIQEDVEQLPAARYYTDKDDLSAAL